jgi:hypothetical protein
MDKLLMNLSIYSLFNNAFSSPGYIYAYVTYVGLCVVCVCVCVSARAHARVYVSLSH